MKKAADTKEGLRPGQKREQNSQRRLDATVAATRERVKNTRRMIAQSKELVGRARKALQESKIVHQSERTQIELAKKALPRE